MSHVPPSPVLASVLLNIQEEGDCSDCKEGAEEDGQQVPCGKSCSLGLAGCGQLSPPPRMVTASCHSCCGPGEAGKKEAPSAAGEG